MYESVEFVVDKEAEKKDLEKYANFSFLLDIWLGLVEDGRSVAEYFENNMYKNVAIYGMGLLGKHLFNELSKCCEIKIIYTIERNIATYPDSRRVTLEELKADERIPDVVVVTPVMEFYPIKKRLEGLFSTRIVSIEEVILSI